MFACAVGQAGPYKDAFSRIEKLHAKQTIEVESALGDVASKPLVSDLVSKYASARSADREERFSDLKWRLQQLSRLEEESATDHAAGEAAAIKSSHLFRDSGSREGNSWLKNALDQLHFNMPQPTSSSNSAIPDIFGTLLVYLVWGAIGVAVGILIYVAVKHVNWKKSLRRKASSIVEEDEPERSLDEWLGLADQLTSEGRYREAVRALYIACLLRFDEARVARFDRGQTNWEHLRRIETSHRLPAGIDFRETTRQFDRIWYGFAKTGLESVAQFRDSYTRIKTATEAVAA